MHNAFDIAEHFVIPKPQDAKTLRCNPIVSNGVTLPRFRVLAAIELDDKPGFEAYEIDDVSSGRLLPLELAAIEPVRANPAPQQSFGIG